MDPQREQQLAQAAQQLAGAVYHFLQQAAAACSSLNAALFAAQGETCRAVAWIAMPDSTSAATRFFAGF